MIGLLRHREFSLLWWGGLISVAGDWILIAVLPYVVYVRTGSTIATAGMTVAELVPGILLGSLAGVLVDRWDRQRVMVIVNLLQAPAVLALLLLTTNPRFLPVVYVVAAAQSVLASFSLPAESSLLPTLVEHDDLVSANALNLLNNRIGRLAGLPLGPVLYAAGGLDVVAMVDAASFALAALLIAAIRIPPTAPVDAREDPEPRVLAQWRDGLALVGRDRSIRVLFVVFGLMTFGGTMLDPLAAPWVRDILHGGDDVYALLMTVHAGAGICGSLLVGALGARLSPRTLCGAGSALAGTVLLVRFNVPILAVAIVLSLVSGITSVGSSVGVETLTQQRVPATHRGRVFGALQATIWTSSLLGAALGGAGAELIGLAGMLDIASCLVLAAGIVVLLALPKAVLADLSPEQAETSP